MYQPAKYAKKDPTYLFQFIQQNPFGTMVVQGERLLATHIPIMTKGGETDFYLIGHIANKNPQYGVLKDGVEALFIFQGPNAYVSSSWYDYEDISTWDYSAVHVHATIYLQTAVELETSLQELVYRFEKDQSHPKFYKDIPASIVRDHLPQITGFKAVPTRMEGIAKFHQETNTNTLNSIYEHLKRTENKDAHEVAEHIRKENS
ncbi:MAG: negative transcriptional regulator [Flavobacteriaceae bacterium]|nr:negative transcriptional regulator [Flavobacteriaceae bacterium]